MNSKLTHYPHEPAVVLSQRSPQGRFLTVLEWVIFYGLIAVIGLTAVPYGTVEAWSEALFECAVFSLGLLWIIHGFLAGSWRPGNMRLFYPMIALLAFATVQSISWWQTNSASNNVWYALSSDPFGTWAFALRLAALILAGVLSVRFTSSNTRLGVLVHAVITVALASAIFGIVRETMQHEQGFVLPFLKYAAGYGQFINKNHFAFLVEMAMGLIVGVALMRSGRRQHIPLYFSALLLLWAALVLSKSRGGLLAVTVQMIFTALLLVYSRKRTGAGITHNDRNRFGWTRSIALTLVLIVALLVVIVAGIGWLGGDQLSTGVETAAVEMGSDRSEVHEGTRRRDIWRATWLMFRAHPIAGAGLGGFWAEVPVYHDGSGASTPQQAHNDYLELLASGGIVGVTLLLWFLVALVRQTRASVRASEGFQRSVLLGAIVGLVGIGVHSVVDFGLHITINALIFVVLIAILSLSKMWQAPADVQAHPSPAFK